VGNIKVSRLLEIVQCLPEGCQTLLKRVPLNQGGDSTALIGMYILFQSASPIGNHSIATDPFWINVRKEGDVESRMNLVISW
jgi:hypothetical protein